MRDWVDKLEEGKNKTYKPSRQPRAYMQKNMREGRWHILTSPLTRDCRMWHNCEKYGNIQDLVKHKHIHEAKYWDERGYTRDFADEARLAWRCVECNQEAPEGLTGIYVMMDWDRSTREISESTQYSEGEFSEVPF